jgi:hypothetical protein
MDVARPAAPKTFQMELGVVDDFALAIDIDRSNMHACKQEHSV